MLGVLRRIFGGEFFQLSCSGSVKLFVPMPDAGADEIVVDANGSNASDGEQGQGFVVAAELLKPSSPVYASMLKEKTWKESSAERIHLTNGFHPDGCRVFFESLALMYPLSGAPINDVPQYELQSSHAEPQSSCIRCCRSHTNTRRPI